LIGADIQRRRPRLPVDVSEHAFKRAFCCPADRACTFREQPLHTVFAPRQFELDASDSHVLDGPATHDVAEPFPSFTFPAVNE
jgi:hypothetical protein